MKYHTQIPAHANEMSHTPMSIFPLQQQDIGILVQDNG